MHFRIHEWSAVVIGLGHLIGQSNYLTVCTGLIDNDPVEFVGHGVAGLR